MENLELSIVIPCLNEAETLGICLEKASTFLKQNNIKGEIIVVDNGNEDESATIANNAGARLIKESARGYGAAIKAGVKASQAKYIIMGDADDSYDFSSLMPFLRLLREGNDLVIGNRYKGGIQKGSMPALHRYLGNPVLSFIGRRFFRIKTRDFHCGLRGFSKSAFEKMGLQTVGMEFASEMIVKAALLRLSISETPVVYYPDKRSRASHLRTWRDGWRHLRFLLLFSPRWLFLIPGIILMLIGIIGSGLLISGPISIGERKLDVHTLMYTCCFLILGFQFISFYLFAKLYADTHSLLPFDKGFAEKFSRYFGLERGIIIGFLLILAGIILTIKSVLYWKNEDFGNLDPVKVLRWVIPAVTLLILGFQVLLSSFYLSILTIKSKRNNS